MKIDIVRVHQDLTLIVASIRELKAKRREPKQPRWTGVEIRELEIDKDNATLLCSLIAHSRNRLHIKGTTSEKQEEYVRGAFQQYSMPDVQAA